MDGDHRRVTGVIGVVYGRPVGNLRALPHRVVVRHRNRLAVGNAKPMEMACARRPGAHTCRRTRLHEIDRRHAAEVMPLAVAREVLFVGAPAHLAGLTALADESVDRPGVDELARYLWDGGHLVVTLGDVHHLDTQL